MVRREWRSQVLVLTLLTVSVAAAIVGASAAYNLAPSSGNAEFGSAHRRITINQPDPQKLEGDIAAAQELFGDVDVIARKFVAVPGLFEPVELRAQDPSGTYAAPMLALVDGRYPTQAGEIALTDGTASVLDVSMGDTVDLDSQTWTVVGTVENPSNLKDEFALVAPAQILAADSVNLLVDGGPATLRNFRLPGGGNLQLSVRPTNEAAAAAVGVLVASTVVLMFVGLIAAAGFVVVARRRLRQLGMLAAIGATQRHLRLVMMANGLVVGTIAALAGAAVGLATWVAGRPSLEKIVAHRIAPFDVPWWVLGAGMLLAVLSATAAAWWPARAIARTPVVAALSGRPDRPRSARRPAMLSVVMITAGMAGLGFGNGRVTTGTDVFLIIGGTAALVIGVLLVSPLAIRLVARPGTHMPVAFRLALADLARYHGRSGTALAAMSLALGTATTIVIIASGATYGGADEGNLSDRQVLIRIAPPPGQSDRTVIAALSPAEIGRLTTVIDRMGASLDATVINLDVAVAPSLKGLDGLPTIELGMPLASSDGYRALGKVYVASPALLALYGIDETAIDATADVLTTETGELWFLPMRDAPVETSQHLTPSYSSLPGSFVTPEALAARGWQEAPAGWLLQAPAPITDAQLAGVRSAAAAAGVTVEVRDDQAGLSTLLDGATTAGALLALAVMAMTIGLIRSESTADIRILTAAGATSSNRRTLTAATAGGLAVLGAGLGVVGAYLGAGAAYIRDLDSLTPVPYVHLLIIVVGLPVVAAAAGWLLAGREPPWLARTPLD